MKYLAIIVILMLAGCLPQSPEDNSDYRSGTEGLVISFGDSAQKVYEGSKMNLVVELRNKGATDLRNGNIYLSGYDPVSILFSRSDMPVPDIMGKNAYVSEGGFDTIIYDETGPVRVPFGEEYKPTLMLSSCYQYQTLATPTVCVLSNPGDIIKDKVCRPETITMSGQGAPVAVTKIEEEVMEQMLNFIITVENVGSGKVVALESLSRCPFQMKHSDLDYVDVKVQMSGAGEAQCTPGAEDTPGQGRIRLVNGKGVIFCKIPVEMETSYTTPLIIQLDYAYSNSVTKEFEIVRPPGSPKQDLGTPVPVTPDTTGGGTTPVTPGGTQNNQYIADPDCGCGPSHGYGDPNDPCVCLFRSSSNIFCDPSQTAPDYSTSDAVVTFIVRGSHSGLENCGIPGQMGRCPHTVQVPLSRGQITTVTVSANGPGGIASQTCRIYGET